jgi:hypothetical protein
VSDEPIEPGNPTQFDYAYFRRIVEQAQAAGYRFVTLDAFRRAGCPERGHFILRHDLDTRPASLGPLLDLERALGVPSTVFVRVMGAEYNPFGYQVFPVLRAHVEAGGEVGLHTNFVEYAVYCRLDPWEVLSAEVAALRRFFPVSGVACHRDINYRYNSLPVLERHWAAWRDDLGLRYQAYDPAFFAAAHYVNEGLDPHLGWRRLVPEDMIPEGRSIYLLTHSHWWYRDHPHEF